MLPTACAVLAETPEWAGELARALTLRAGYNATVVLLAATALGVAAGVVGTFALLRGRALMTDAVAHASLPGIAGAFLVATWLGARGRTLPVLLAGAAASAVAGVLLVSLIVRHTRLREDAAIAIVLSVLFGLGITLLSYIQTIPSGTQAGLHHFIFGQPAAMSRGDALLIACAAVIALLGAAALFKEFRIVCFDDRFAASAGLPVGSLDLLMMGLIVGVTVIGLQSVGLIMAVALLIVPAAAARFWTERLARMTILAGVIGGLSGYIGAGLSAAAPRMPAGSVIVLTAGALFIVSLVAAPARGVVSTAIRRGAMRIRIARDHALRAMYEALDTPVEGPGAGIPVPRRALARLGPSAGAALALLRAQGLIARADGGIALTDAGLARARAVTRNHRLWEEFLVTHAAAAPSHVHRSADMVEHVLSADLVAQLERALLERGVLPGGPRPSIHPLDGAAGEPA